MVNRTIDITVPDGFIRQAVLTQIAERLNVALNRMRPGVISGVKAIITKAVESSPEYESILTGRLWHELGVVNPGPVLLNIINAITESIQVENHGVQLVGTELSGGMSIGILSPGYSEILDLSDSWFISENGYKVEWLKWLLLAGEGTVIADYFYIPVERESSRTRIGIMVKSKKGWRVPIEFAGTESNNWLIRAIGSTSEEVADVFGTELLKQFNS